jgi:arylsulfatase A-like enzyme
MTGKQPYAHGARSNAGFALPERNITLAERLREAGYVTAAEIAAPVIGRHTRLDQGFAHYGDVASPGIRRKSVWKHSTSGRKRVDLNERDAGDITAHAIEFLRQNRQERFLLWLHYFDPHQLYLPPAAHAARIPDSPYHAEVRFVDEQIGKVVDELLQLGLRGRTLVVITSDHGEGLGEHGEETHIFLVYESTIRVPLILWGPFDLPRGARTAPVSGWCLPAKSGHGQERRLARVCVRRVHRVARHVRRRRIAFRAGGTLEVSAQGERGAL